MRYGQADIPREVSGRGRPVVGPAAADFPRDVCLTVSRNHKVFLLYQLIPFYPSALRAGGVLSSRSGRPGGRAAARLAEPISL